MTTDGPAAALYWRVELERARLGWSATELANQSGVNRSTVYRMRTSRRTPLPSTVLDLAKTLDIDRDEALHLAGLIDQPDRAPEEAAGVQVNVGTWTYDPEVGVAYVTLHGPIPEGGVAVTSEVDAAVTLDYDADGRVIGIEIVAEWPERAPEGTTP